MMMRLRLEPLTQRELLIVVMVDSALTKSQLNLSQLLLKAEAPNVANVLTK